jgi:hypothetical protein
VAAPWTVTDVKALASEFSGLSDPEIQRFINDAALEINTAVFGAKAVRAGTLLTAHLLTTLTPGASGGPAVAGPIQSERVGDVQTTYAVPTIGSPLGQAAGLATSKYGVEYARLVRQCASGAWVI